MKTAGATTNGGTIAAPAGSAPTADQTNPFACDLILPGRFVPGRRRLPLGALLPRVEGLQISLRSNAGKHSAQDEAQGLQTVCRGPSSHVPEHEAGDVQGVGKGFQDDYR